MIRMLTEGVRREELAQQQTSDLSEVLIARPFARAIPLKGAREYSEGRLVPLAMGTAQAVVMYLRVRRSHRKAKSPALWLGTRGPMTGSGVYQMLQRRADQAGYDPDVHPHQFRHTFAHDWQVSRIASGASFGSLREHALPAAQDTALSRSRHAVLPCGSGDLRLRGPLAPNATTMHLLSSRRAHHCCGRWHHEAPEAARLRRMHHRQAARGRDPTKGARGRTGSFAGGACLTIHRAAAVAPDASPPPRQERRQAAASPACLSARRCADVAADGPRVRPRRRLNGCS